MAMELDRPQQKEGAFGSLSLDPLDRFTCPVCLEVYENPVTVKCGHVFCMVCLQECLKPRQPVCAVCRSNLTPGTRAMELEKLIETTESTCRGCDKKISLSRMRGHVASCSKYQSYIMAGIKAATKDQTHDTRDVPNRFTFPCPYCIEKNFDQDGLVEHCKKYHSLDNRPVVCPICASMPWGDPHYRSGNFMEHIRRRHQFSYDTFVDYDADEEAMMNDALMRSLMDK